MTILGPGPIEMYRPTQKLCPISKFLINSYKEKDDGGKVHVIAISNYKDSMSQEQVLYEGDRLACLLDSIKRGIESARRFDGSALPEKIWLKQQFSIGVNDVTRVLERMDPVIDTGILHENRSVVCRNRKGPLVNLQAIIVEADCTPRWLTKHIPGLALSRKVPVIYIKDNKKASLRLGEVFKLKTAIAIGVKARGNAINQIVGDNLHREKPSIGTECVVVSTAVL